MADLKVREDEGRILFEGFTPTQKDKGIKVHTKAVAALKNWFAKMGLGQGTFDIPDKNEYHWKANTKSALKWINKYDENFKNEIAKDLKTNKEEANKRIVEKIEVIVHSLVGKSDEELEIEARNGNKEAQFLLGDRYIKEAGVDDETKLKEGYDWILLAAKNGHPHAQVRCGVYAEKGVDFNGKEFFPKSHEDSIRWFLVAASSQNEGKKAPHYIRFAEEKLALYFDPNPEFKHENPEIPGLERSEEIAATWYLRAYKNGSYDQDVMRGLADYYRNGKGGLPKDPDIAQQLENELREHQSL